MVKAGRLADLPPGQVTEVLVGQHPYAVCNVDGNIYALDGVCLHEGGPLGQGQLEGARVVCPYHLWEFDCRTGEYDQDHTCRVATYPAHVENGEIVIEVP